MHWKAPNNSKTLIHGKYTILMYIHPHWGLLCTYRGQKATILSWEKISLVEKILNAPGHPRDVQSTTRPPGWMDNTDIMNFRPFSSLSWTDKPSTNASWEKLALYNVQCTFGLLMAYFSSYLHPCRLLSLRVDTFSIIQCDLYILQWMKY